MALTQKGRWFKEIMGKEREMMNSVELKSLQGQGLIRGIWGGEEAGSRKD